MKGLSETVGQLQMRNTKSRAGIAAINKNHILGERGRCVYGVPKTKLVFLKVIFFKSYF